MAAAILDNSQSHLENGDKTWSTPEPDPFVEDQSHQQQSHRYSSLLDSDYLALDVTSSPSQLKRTLQAHISETDRRLRDAQRLGTSLLEQQKELSQKLSEIEAQEDLAEISPELQKRLAELEKEHNEVSRDIAKALLAPRARVVSADEKPSDDSRQLSSLATASPSKISAPSRRQRNQPDSRVGDIQFAADISTSLLAQVRQLQAALSERDEAMKAMSLEKAKLEHDAENFSQRLRAQDESEQRYKDENWNLETQRQELLMAAKEAADRGKKLSNSLAAALAEKAKVQNDLDEITVAHGRLIEDHSSAQKAHDSELHSLRRTVEAADTERSTLQKRVEELTGQNQELAKAVAARLRNKEGGDDAGIPTEMQDPSADLSTPEHSPPPSPTKATPRHGGLESETLKSSLHHAHRMIQNLKSNMHREKTEKIELKRMLQDARDELEQRRADGFGSGSKRQKSRPEAIKKPSRPDLLGGSRRTRTDVEMGEQDWEDHAGDDSPSQTAASRRLAPGGSGSNAGLTDTSDAYQTANETEGDFETANERDTTESEDFMTGAESLAGDSNDELTETEDRGSSIGDVKTRRSLPLKTAGNRSSFMSTASTSAGEDENDLKTPVQAQQPKYRLKVGRAGNIRSSRNQLEGTPESGQSIARDSPASYLEGQSPPAGERSLFSELGEFDEAGIDNQFGTPAQPSEYSARSAPSSALQDGRKILAASGPVRRVTMIDSGTMTDPWRPELAQSPRVDSKLAVASPATTTEALTVPALPEDEVPFPSPSDFPLPPSLKTSPIRPDDITQFALLEARHESPLKIMESLTTPPKTVWDEHDKLPESTNTASEVVSTVEQAPPLSLSGICSQEIRPITPPSREARAARAQGLGFSAIKAQEIVPFGSESAGPSGFVAREEADSLERPKTAEKLPVEAAGIGVFASVGAALGLRKAKGAPNLVIAEDESSQPADANGPMDTSHQSPLAELSSNEARSRVLGTLKVGHADDIENQISSSSSDRASQTLLTSLQIEAAFVAQNKSRAELQISPEPVPKSASKEAVPPNQVPHSSRSSSRSRDRVLAGETSSLRDSGLSPRTSPQKRPGSAGSQRPASATQSHPPLPPDHKNVIARVGGRLSAPVGELHNSGHVSSVMGPPIAPASAYRRPLTPVDQSVSIGSPVQGVTTPRASHASRVRTSTQVSRRSSVSSFASELDERFNIRSYTTGPRGNGYEAGPGTDPRMIQAITQTMIGEFLWKYTRKAGRPDMSSTRHRRYFWVHPYTRTLYWSDQDPQSAGRSELKAKSVAIESVRVVSDDNHMPPGLHCKSLEVTTPGRKVRFTASTGQRHETWFNALSYLLLRGQDAVDVGAYSTGGAIVTDGGLTAKDVNEFNPSFARIQQATNGSGASLSSYNSRTTHGTSAQGTRQSLPGNVVSTATVQPAVSRGTVRHQYDPDQTVRKGTASARLSRVLNSVRSRSRPARASEPGAGMSGSNGETRNQGSIYNASIVSDGGPDSAEELRREMVNQEKQSDRLENVRACCDGE